MKYGLLTGALWKYFHSERLKIPEYCEKIHSDPFEPHEPIFVTILLLWP